MNEETEKHAVINLEKREIQLKENTMAKDVYGQDQFEQADTTLDVSGVNQKDLPLFDVTKEGQELSDATDQWEALKNDAEENCLYIHDNLVVDIHLNQKGGSSYLGLPSFKIASLTFEILASGLWTLLPVALGVKMEEIGYSHGIQINGKTARAFGRYEFKNGCAEIEGADIQKKVQTCIDLLVNKNLWNDKKMNQSPLAQTPGLIVQARQVRSQIGTRELPNSCMVSGALMKDEIRIERKLGVPKPLVLEDIPVVSKGEVKGFHGEFRLMHFVYGSHRKVIDIGFDEATYLTDIRKYSSADKIIVEASWIERREDGVVKFMTLTGLKLIMETLFEMKK